MLVGCKEMNHFDTSACFSALSAWQVEDEVELSSVLKRTVYIHAIALREMMEMFIYPTVELYTCIIIPARQLIIVVLPMRKLRRGSFDFELLIARRRKAARRALLSAGTILAQVAEAACLFIQLYSSIEEKPNPTRLLLSKNSEDVTWGISRPGLRAECCNCAAGIGERIQATHHARACCIGASSESETSGICCSNRRTCPGGHKRAKPGCGSTGWSERGPKLPSVAHELSRSLDPMVLLPIFGCRSHIVGAAHATDQARSYEQPH